jgi:hypothetical protein
VSGRVVDGNGAGVADATVTVESGTAATPEIAIVTGADGSFTVALPEGTFRLGARTRDGRDGKVDLSLPATGALVIVIRRS